MILSPLQTSLMLVVATAWPVPERLGSVQLVFGKMQYSSSFGISLAQAFVKSKNTKILIFEFLSETGC